MEDIVKPLRNMCDNHSKVKKPVRMFIVITQFVQ